MFCFLYRSLFRSGNERTLAAQNVVSLSSFLRYLSSDANQHSFTVSHLINTFGFSEKSALKASKSIQFESAEKPDLILSFFKKLGFSKTQVSEIIRKSPNTLLSNPEKTIFPKVEFFRSKLASTPELVRIITSCPLIIHVSLEHQLVPSFNFFREWLQSEEAAISAVKQFPRALCHASIIPNINLLIENGVPKANILLLLRCSPRALAINFIKLGKTLEELREMGFNPLKSKFVVAYLALAGISKSKRDKKVDAYKRWGWSDDDISRAFQKYPWCMTISEDKIMAAMDFYVNKLGVDSLVIANRPLLLSLSLKKRLIPRAEVFQFLSSKGRVKLNSRVSTLFGCTEKYFLEHFVNRHEEAPHLLKLYNDKLRSFQTTRQ